MGGRVEVIGFHRGRLDRVDRQPVRNPQAQFEDAGPRHFVAQLGGEPQFVIGKHDLRSIDDGDLRLDGAGFDSQANGRTVELVEDRIGFAIGGGDFGGVDAD